MVFGGGVGVLRIKSTFPAGMWIPICRPQDLASVLPTDQPLAMLLLRPSAPYNLTVFFRNTKPAPSSGPRSCWLLSLEDSPPDFLLVPSHWSGLRVSGTFSEKTSLTVLLTASPSLSSSLSIPRTGYTHWDAKQDTMGCKKKVVGFLLLLLFTPFL